ncbi:L-aspartate oxidase [Ectobacillus funiculus]|uniref:L-aspartate oxidase n=1 Tax=Ectobacillus funiculus TaxID=137993 RepID=A0ABV5WLH0_9BACI
MDVLIVGSGLAALQTANRLSRSKNVMLITKKTRYHNNSNMAQGGVAAVFAPEDHWTSHYKDTLLAGCHYNNKAAVQYLVQEGSQEIHHLIQDGMVFDGDGSGPSLGQEGAHSMRRILHAGGDATGAKIMQHTLQHLSDQVQVIENEMVLDLIVEDGRCLGVITRDEEGSVKHYYASHTVLATGGSGSLYSFSSNNGTITGDGLAMAYRAGAELVDLEFVQFHPTMLYVDGECRGLISEAVRGEGALLYNSRGERFMEDIHEQKELAPRDVVARAIHEQILRGEKVYLDITMIDCFASRFPTIASLCESNGISLEEGRIPVVPGAHFHMGGIRTNLDGETTVPGLYAVGEAACNGVHGANRLASNSLLECLVFGKRLGEYLLTKPTTRIQPRTQNHQAAFPDIMLPSKGDLQEMMMKHAGIVRTEQSLQEVKQWIECYLSAAAGEALPYEVLTNEQVIVYNMMTAAWLIVIAALERRESIGGHYRSDFPNRSEAPRPIVLSKETMLSFA